MKNEEFAAAEGWLIGLKTNRTNRTNGGSKFFILHSSFFISSVPQFLSPFIFVRKALALPKRRNMSRRTGTWLASSVT